MKCVVRRYTRLLYRIARIYLFDGDAAEEVSVAVYSEAYKKRSGMKAPGDYRNYLVRAAIAYCKSLTHSGFEATQPMEEEEDEAPVAVLADKLNTFEKAIDALPLSLKAPVILCSLESFTTADAVALLGLDERVVEARLKLANSRLRGRLLKWYHEENIFCCNGLCTDRIAARVMESI